MFASELTSKLGESRHTLESLLRRALDNTIDRGLFNDEVFTSLDFNYLNLHCVSHFDTDIRNVTLALFSSVLWCFGTLLYDEKRTGKIG